MTITFGPGSIAIVASAAAISAVALMIALALRSWVLKQDEGSDGMHAIAEAVQEGAQAYLARQMRTLAPIAGVVFVLLFALPGETSVRVGRSVAFLSGAYSRGRSGTSACGWPSEPMCGWLLRPETRTARATVPGSLSGRAGWSACRWSAWVCWVSVWRC